MGKRAQFIWAGLGMLGLLGGIFVPFLAVLGVGAILYGLTMPFWDRSRLQDADPSDPVLVPLDEPSQMIQMLGAIRSELVDFQQRTQTRLFTEPLRETLDDFDKRLTDALSGRTDLQIEFANLIRPGSRSDWSATGPERDPHVVCAQMVVNRREWVDRAIARIMTPQMFVSKLQELEATGKRIRTSLHSLKPAAWLWESHVISNRDRWFVEVRVSLPTDALVAEWNAVVLGARRCENEQSMDKPLEWIVSLIQSTAGAAK